LRNFTGLARALVAVPMGGEKGLAPDALAATAQRIGIAAQTAGSIEDALDMVRALELTPPPRVLITGSLYLAGDALAANGTPPG
jgi:dihydrofolate synthase/folylpolyglutamate synthase